MDRDRETERHRERHRLVIRERERERQRERQRDRQDRQTDRQTDRQRQREIRAEGHQSFVLPNRLRIDWERVIVLVTFGNWIHRSINHVISGPTGGTGGIKHT